MPSPFDSAFAKLRSAVQHPAQCMVEIGNSREVIDAMVIGFAMSIMTSNNIPPSKEHMSVVRRWINTGLFPSLRFKG